MVFRDQKLVCEECGKAFFFTVTEQRRLAEQLDEGTIVAPKRCNACRRKGESVSPARQEREDRREKQVREPVVGRRVERRAEQRVERRAERRADEEAEVDQFPLEEEGVEVKLIGRVKWFSLRKGYGFITKADGQDVFFHRADILGRQVMQIEEDQQVEFQIRRTEKGLEAFNVSILPLP